MRANGHSSERENAAGAAVAGSNELPTLSLAAAAKHFPKRGGKHPTVATLLRWRAKGVSVAGKGRVRLQAKRVGGAYFTSEAWIAQFINEQNPPAMELGLRDAARPAVAVRTPRQSAWVRRQLAARGYTHAEATYQGPVPAVRAASAGAGALPSPLSDGVGGD